MNPSYELIKIVNVIPKIKKEKKYLSESENYVIYNDYFSSIQLISIIPQ